jgi:hypothetical protein
MRAKQATVSVFHGVGAKAVGLVLRSVIFIYLLADVRVIFPCIAVHHFVKFGNFV